MEILKIYKNFFSILIIFLFVIPLSKADESIEFQISGMSLKESLLNHYGKNEINKTKYYGYKLKDYYTVSLPKRDDLFDDVQVNIKENDEKFIIESIEGAMDIENLPECIKKKEIIEKEIMGQFPNLKFSIGKLKSHSADPTGSSKTITTDLFFKKSFRDGAAIRIMCTDWSKNIEKKKWSDSFRVIINSNDFNNFINKNYN
tara:strand:+ start:232 stop:837 length:606 start_codon:yes stop_codon:yes gene_type:complete